LADNIYHLSYDAETETSPQILWRSHGTPCAGIVGAVQNNDIGISGVAPNCKLMSISIDLEAIVPVGTPPTAPLLLQQKYARGINWAWQNKADVISCSWGSYLFQGTFIADAIDSAITYGRGGKGCVLVFASGNFYHQPIIYPAPSKPKTPFSVIICRR